MRILAVDTSSRVAAAAVMENDNLLGEYIINYKKTHSQQLVPMVKDLMENLELTPKDIDVYAASSGPGSFTGLRIGITTIKAIAYAANKPVISVPTLDALAYNIPLTDSLVCPIMDARNNQVYTAIYKWDGLRLSKMTEYMGVYITELIAMVKGKNQKAMFLGDGVETHGALIKDELGDVCEMAPGNLLLQRGSSVAYAARARITEGMLENCFDMVPYYLRKSQAEREYEKRCGNSICEKG